MSTGLQILLRTPWWVFPLFALVIWSGLQALRPRTISLWRLLITPAVFIGWGVISLVFQSLHSPVLLITWVIMAVVGAAIAWATRHPGAIRIDAARQLVSIPGSVFPLIRTLLLFSAKYSLGVAMATMPASRPDIVVWNSAVSGISAGYFLGWSALLFKVWRQYGRENAPADVDPAAFSELSGMTDERHP